MYRNCFVFIGVLTLLTSHINYNCDRNKYLRFWWGIYILEFHELKRVFIKLICVLICVSVYMQRQRKNYSIGLYQWLPYQNIVAWEGFRKNDVSQPRLAENTLKNRVSSFIKIILIKIGSKIALRLLSQHGFNNMAIFLKTEVRMVY